MKSLGEFIVEKQAEYPHARGNLSGILAAIRLAAKVINRDINRAGLVHEILGDAGAENVQGEQQKKLDVFAHKTISAAFFARDDVAGFASEEEENFIAFDSEKNRNAKYIVLTDPLDGSSNIDVNVSVGTIFSIYRRVTPVGTPVTLEDFLQPGRAQVAAGYVVYGSSTMLVYTTGNGVNGFTYDPGIGVFALSHENIRIPEDGKDLFGERGPVPEVPAGREEVHQVLSGRPPVRGTAAHVALHRLAGVGLPPEHAEGRHLHVPAGQQLSEGQAAPAV